MFSTIRFCPVEDVLTDGSTGETAELDAFENGQQVYYRGTIQSVSRKLRQDLWNRYEYLEVACCWKQRRIEHGRWETYHGIKEFHFLTGKRYSEANVYADGRFELGAGLGEILVVSPVGGST